MATVNEHIIEAVGLYKNYGSIKAVNGLNFTVYRGDIYGFLGPNGAGKSTTIRMLLSLIKPDKGSIRIFGEELFHNRLKLLGKTGSLIEKPGFYEFLTAYRNLEILSYYSGISPDRKKILDLLDFIGLGERANSKVSTYSQGMKQRLGIAQAMLHDPDLLILDEPLNGLDPQGILDIRNIILKLNREKGKTIFLSSHILHEIEMVANRMVIINKGKSVVEGTVCELLHTGKLKVTFLVEKCDLALDELKTTQFMNSFLMREDNNLQFLLEKEEIALLNRYLVGKGFDITSIKPVHTLEDYFIKITGE